MKNLNKKELYKLAIEAYGREERINKGIEEMAELIKAVIRYNSMLENYIRWYDIVEGIVNVEIMLEQYKQIYEIPDKVLSEFKSKKLQELSETIDDD